MLTLERVDLVRDGFELRANLSIEAPGIVAVIGSSGGGKSTLLSVIAGFETPDLGRILWDGLDLSPLAPGDRPVAVLFQDNNLFPHLDAETNVALGISPQAVPGREARERARAALARVGLQGYETRRPGELSGGQQSRTALARVLLTKKPVVLMDEAFSALGPALRAEMLGLVAELLPDALVLMVTHDPGDALRWAARTILVDDGRVSAARPTADLFADPPEALRRYLE